QRADDPVGNLTAKLQPFLTAPLTCGDPSECSRLLEEVTERLDERMAAPEAAENPIYLVIHDLARFRDLQPDADEWGLGRFSQATGSGAASPAAQLSRILRDGPAVGVHTIVWADSYNTL